jgi:energy-coupling factor transporter ATP-binding protein EcfA2
MSEIRFRGFGWRHAGRRTWAVRGLDLEIRHGERVLLLGPSGAGKSTLLNVLAGLLHGRSGESEGTVEIDGLEPRKARERSGIAFQDPRAQLVMARSGDDVAFGCENRGMPARDIWPRVSDMLDRVGFAYPINRPTAALSGGEAQRLALAGVLAPRPGLLLLDEPTAHLDRPGAALLRAAVARVTGPDTTLIIVDHRVAETLPLVDRAVVLAPGGGVRADGTPELVFAAYGDKLAGEGVWVPGFGTPPVKATAGSTTCLVRVEHAAVDARLAPVTVTAGAGEVLAVTGPNGAGKSTLALLLGGLLAPSSGRVEAFGDPRPPHRWRATTLAGRIGSVFQDPGHQFVTARVADETALGPRRLGRPPAEIRRTVGELLDRLRLAPLAQAHPHTLSGGEARRLSVAAALATAPRLLVLDEPTFGQDRRTWRELVDLLAGLRAGGCGIVVVTQDDAFVRTIADRIVPLGEPEPGPLPRRSRP